MVSENALDSSGSGSLDWLTNANGSINLIAILASIVFVIASSTLVLFLCAICRRYSMDFMDYDKNNTQVIYNVSAGAKELPSEYTLGAYRGYHGEYGKNDFVLTNPAATATDNTGYASSHQTTNNNFQTIDDDDVNCITFQNAAFQHNSP